MKNIFEHVQTKYWLNKYLFYFPFFKNKVLPGIFFKIPLAIQWYRGEIPTTSRPAGENIKPSRKL